MENDSTSELPVPSSVPSSVRSRARKAGLVRGALLGLTLLGLGAVFLEEDTAGLDLLPDARVFARDASVQPGPIMVVSLGDVFARAGR